MKIAQLKQEYLTDIFDGINRNYVIVDAIDAATQNDATTVSNWYALAEKCHKDYCYMRDFAKAEFLPIWATLTAAEKKMLVEYFIYPATFTQADIDTLFTASEQVYNWIKLADVSKKARDKRWEVARRKVSFYLTEEQSLNLYQSTKENSLNYKDVNLPHLVLWISNGAYAPLGIDYTANGFAQKAYYTAALRDLLLDVIKNGNY